jgi:hypothetical protein
LFIFCAVIGRSSHLDKLSLSALWARSETDRSAENRERDIQIDYDGFLAAADDHGFYRFVLAGVEFLMRNVGRDVDEVSRTGFVDKFEVISPAKARAAADHVDYGFEFTVVMRASLCVGVNDDCSRPQFLRADFGVRDSFSTVHAGSLRRVGVEFTTANDAQAVIFPVGHFVARRNAAQSSNDRLTASAPF